MIEDCLRSVRGLVDEIILVDTGSVDATRAIAARYGARVIDEPWRDDFSAPRNTAALAAKGEWILSLDCDERLGPGAARAIAEAISKGDFDCGMLPLHDAVSSSSPPAEVLAGRARIGEPMYLPRLLRRTPDLRWEGIVHESIEGWLSARGGKLRFVEAPIVHYGATEEIRAAKNKGTRNLTLLERRAAMEPDDFLAPSYLAFEHYKRGKLDEAWRWAELGFHALRRGQFPKHRSALRLAVARMTIQCARSDFHGALHTARVVIALEGSHPDLELLRGTAHEQLAVRSKAASSAQLRHLELAEASYRAALAHAGTRWVQRFVDGADGWAAELRLASCAAIRGDFSTALASYARVLAVRPDEREARLGAAECLASAGRVEEALRSAEPMLDARPDAWLIVAEAMERAGMLADAKTFEARARERVESGFIGPHRRARLVALACRVSAYGGRPVAGPGIFGALTALLGRLPFHPDAVCGVPLPAEAVTRMIQTLVRAEQSGQLEGWMEPRAASAFAELPELVRAALAGFGVVIADDGRETPVVLVGDERVTLLHRSILAAHPRLRVCDDAESPPSGLRAIRCAPDLRVAHERWPAGTFVLVDPAPRALALLASLPAEVRAVLSTRAELSSTPKTALETLLAQLGEADAESALRAALECYGREPLPPAGGPWRIVA